MLCVGTKCIIFSASLHSSCSWWGKKRLVRSARDPSRGLPFPWAEADRRFTLLVKRAAELKDCRPGSPEEEFDRLVIAIEAYEKKRWPDGLPGRRQ